jgi:MoaA/NifB/PqqE/SkfB family radical SAM enzyme
VCGAIVEKVKNVDINLGKACNNRCCFCSNGEASPQERRWGRLEDIESEIARQCAEGVESIGFLGGEPTLYPRLERIVRLARSLGYRRVSLCTNGSRLADRKKLVDLLDAGVTRVAVSIHSHTARIEDGITGRRGSFEEKIQALRNLVAMRRQGRLPDGLSLNTVLHRKNVEQLVEFSQFMRDIGINNIRFNLIRPSYKAERSKAWVPSFEITTPNITRLVVNNEKRLGMRLNFADFPLCKLPWEILASRELMERYIGENWDMTTEVTHVLRDPDQEATEEFVRFNWKVRRKEYKTYLPGCARCVLLQHCEGVWQKYLDIYGSGEFASGPAVAEACTAAV